jgi:hypothetical protein
MRTKEEWLILGSKNGIVPDTCFFGYFQDTKAAFVVYVVIGGLWEMITFSFFWLPPLFNAKLLGEPLL